MAHTRHADTPPSTPTPPEPAARPVDRPGYQPEPPSGTGGWASHPLTRLRADMDRLFDDFWSGRRWPLAGEGPGGLEVRTDVAETEDAIEIEAEMPGVAESDVTVELSDGVLTVRGEKRQESEEKKKDRYRCERSYGSFQRAFAVPEAVDVDAIRAEFDKGVLRLTLPKKPEAKATARRIPVGSARAQ